jgi:opacity protein-like surface antigen
MQKIILLTSLFLFSSIAFADIRPVLSVGVGADDTDLDASQTITIMAPFQNTYNARYDDTQTVGSLFVGGEADIPANFILQLGVAYNQDTDFNPVGTVYQFGSPFYGNLNYNYNIRSQRLLGQAKLLYTIKNVIHPYITGAAGEAVNKSFGYVETGVTSADFGMIQTFPNKTMHSFTYALGLGIDVDVGNHMRFGVGYNYLDLGQAALSMAPQQEGSGTLHYNHLNTNELIMQLSFVG